MGCTQGKTSQVRKRSATFVNDQLDHKQPIRSSILQRNSSLNPIIQDINAHDQQSGQTSKSKQKITYKQSPNVSAPQAVTTKQLQLQQLQSQIIKNVEDDGKGKEALQQVSVAMACKDYPSYQQKQKNQGRVQNTKQLSIMKDNEISSTEQIQIKNNKEKIENNQIEFKNTVSNKDINQQQWQRRNSVTKTCLPKIQLSKQVKKELNHYESSSVGNIATKSKQNNESSSSKIQKNDPKQQQRLNVSQPVYFDQQKRGTNKRSQQKSYQGCSNNHSHSCLNDQLQQNNHRHKHEQRKQKQRMKTDYNNPDNSLGNQLNNKSTYDNSCCQTTNNCINNRNNSYQQRSSYVPQKQSSNHIELNQQQILMNVDINPKMNTDNVIIINSKKRRNKVNDEFNNDGEDYSNVQANHNNGGANNNDTKVKKKKFKSLKYSIKSQNFIGSAADMPQAWKVKDKAVYIRKKTDKVSQCSELQSQLLNCLDEQLQKIPQDQGFIRIPLENTYKPNAKTKISTETKIVDKYLHGLQNRLVQEQQKVQKVDKHARLSSTSSQLAQVKSSNLGSSRKIKQSKKDSSVSIKQNLQKNRTNNTEANNLERNMTFMNVNKRKNLDQQQASVQSKKGLNQQLQDLPQSKPQKLIQFTSHQQQSCQQMEKIKDNAIKISGEKNCSYSDLGSGQSSQKSGWVSGFPPLKHSLQVPSPVTNMDNSDEVPEQFGCSYKCLQMNFNINSLNIFERNTQIKNNVSNE